MPERRWPLNFSGGKVIGTLSIVLKMPFSPRIFQKGMLLRRPLISGFERGILYFPIDRYFLGLPILAEDRSGRYVFGSRLRKSKMLCLEGLQPVINEDQATGDMAGVVV